MLYMYVQILCHNLPMCFSQTNKHPVEFITLCSLFYHFPHNRTFCLYGIWTTCDVLSEMRRCLSGALGLYTHTHHRPKTWGNGIHPRHCINASVSPLTVTSLSGFPSNPYFSGWHIHSCWSRTGLDIYKWHVETLMQTNNSFLYAAWRKLALIWF